MAAMRDGREGGRLHDWRVGRGGGAGPQSCWLERGVELSGVWRQVPLSVVVGLRHVGSVKNPRFPSRSRLIDL